MNKLTKTTIGAAIAASFFMSQSVYALPNGKPFQELNALIEENATAIDENGDLIEQNSTAILSLSTELSTLDGRVGVLEATVGGLTTRFATLETNVTSNTNDITLAFAKISSVQSELSNLDATVATNTQAIADAEAAITAAEAVLAQLNTDLFNLNTTVSTNTAAITDVEADIAAAEALLAQLQIDVVTNAAEIEATQSNLNDLNASLASLQAIVDSNVAKISQTETAIFDANNKIDTLTTQYYDLQTLVGANADASDAAIAALKIELLALIEANEANIVTSKAELQVLNAALLQLAQDNSAIAQDLRDQMLALALLVDSNSTSITALQTQVGTLSSMLTTLNAQYNSLSSLYGTLKDHVDGHHDEIAALSLALSGLTNRVVDLEIENYVAPITSYSITDNYNVADDHVIGIRQFFVNTSTLNRWVSVVVSTPAYNRTSELCLYDDNNAFGPYRNTDNTTTSRVVNGSYRSNNGSWTNSQIIVSSSTYADHFRYIDIYETTTYSARAYVIDYYGVYAPYGTSDLFHQNSWWSLNSNGKTTATYSVGDSRIDTCGY